MGYEGYEKEEIAYRQSIITEYKTDVQRLIRYLPWLEANTGKSVSQTFEGSGIRDTSITFPVYDGTLMSFIKEVQQTKLLDRNYVYVYSKMRIRTTADEKDVIQKCDIKEMHVLKGILSKYVLGGMTKGTLWTEAVKNGIFLQVISKMKENLEFWDGPMK